VRLYLAVGIGFAITVWIALIAAAVYAATRIL
jgi:hypothetical protein